MRHGELTVVTPVARMESKEQGQQDRPFLMVVADDDGPFSVIGSQWVQERWAGAAPVEPSTPDHMRRVETIMLREANKRRHRGTFDRTHPMLLERKD